MRGTDFRLAVDQRSFVAHGSRCRSAMGVLFSGQGWGTRVGLCQWCSQEMAAWATIMRQFLPTTIKGPN